MKKNSVSPTILAAVAEAIRAEAGNGNVLDRYTAAALSNFQPLNNALLPGGVGYLQSPFIGENLLPPVSASPDGTLKATYFTFGKELFLNLPDEIGMYGEHIRADLGLTQANITLVKHGKSAWIDPDERSAAAAMGLNIDDEKAKVIRTQVETRKEALAAALLTTSGNYLSSSHYATLSGTTQWSHASSTPIAAITAKIEYVRSVIGVRPNVLWLSPTAYNALRFHASILALVNGGATRQNPAAPVGADILSAIFGVNVFVGEAVNTTAVGGAAADIWNDCAGLLYVGGTGMYDPKFGCTLVSSGYPTQRTERDPHKGSKGIDVLYYDDAYTHAVQLSSAGYLWIDVTA